MLLERRQNIEPPKKTKNGHRVAAMFEDVISMSSGWFKLSFVGPEKKSFEL